MQSDDHQSPEPQKVKPAKRVSWAPTVKWIAICLTMLMFTAILYKAYRITTAPVRGVNAAVETVTDRLAIDIKKERSFGQLAEEAFTALEQYPVQEQATANERLMWAQSLRGSNKRVCRLNINFGQNLVPVYAAANNKSYATAKAVGSKEGRIIRTHILTKGRAVDLRAYWDHTDKNWKMRWRRLTFGKPLNDETAQNTLRKILADIPERCKTNAD